MSTSSARDLAVQYSTASTATLPILFECDVGQVSVSLLSSALTAGLRVQCVWSIGLVLKVGCGE
eukprot:1619926-Rhodomonas_salina.1